MVGEIHLSISCSLPDVAALHLGTTMTRMTFVATLVFTACLSFRPVAYVAQPARSFDPAAEVISIIKANTAGGCISDPSIANAVLLVKFVCSNGLGNTVAKLDRVEKIYLEQYHDWYRVVVRHVGGGDDFSWSSKSLDDMQRLADALTALSMPKRHSDPSTDHI